MSIHTYFELFLNLLIHNLSWILVLIAFLAILAIAGSVIITIENEDKKDEERNINSSK